MTPKIKTPGGMRVQPGVLGGSIETNESIGILYEFRSDRKLASEYATFEQAMHVSKVLCGALTPGGRKAAWVVPTLSEIEHGNSTT